MNYEPTVVVARATGAIKHSASDYGGTFNLALGSCANHGGFPSALRCTAGRPPNNGASLLQFPTNPQHRNRLLFPQLAALMALMAALMAAMAMAMAMGVQGEGVWCRPRGAGELEGAVRGLLQEQEQGVRRRQRRRSCVLSLCRYVAIALRAVAIALCCYVATALRAVAMSLCRYVATALRCYVAMSLRAVAACCRC